MKEEEELQPVVRRRIVVSIVGLQPFVAALLILTLIRASEFEGIASVLPERCNTLLCFDSLLLCRPLWTGRLVFLANEIKIPFVQR